MDVNMNTSRMIDANMPREPSRETTAESRGASVPDEAVRREFDRLHSRESPRNMPAGTRGGEVADFSGPAARDSGDIGNESLSSLMSRLFSERLGAASAPVAQSAPADVVNTPRMAETVDRLVEQILVSHPDQLGDKEVRLRVRNSVLPDTEIRLSRGADGLLSVTLATGRSDALQTLVAARADLKQALDTRENREIRLTVVDTRDAGAEDGNSDRRSRGHAAYAPDDGGEARPGR
jgi:type III secretion system needle length determinant